LIGTDDHLREPGLAGIIHQHNTLAHWQARSEPRAALFMPVSKFMQPDPIRAATVAYNVHFFVGNFAAV
jgi:hypothetical protein